MDPLNDPRSYTVDPGADLEVRCIVPGYASFGGRVREDAIRAGVIL